MSFREAFLALFGIAATPMRPSIHDDRVHDAANRETVMMAKLHLADRAGERVLGPMIAAQQSDPQADDLRRGAEKLRKTIANRQQGMDAIEAMLRGRQDR